jgi:hypothetical protein
MRDAGPGSCSHGDDLAEPSATFASDSTRWRESEYEVPWTNGKGAGRTRYIYAVGAVVVEDEASLELILAKLAELRVEVSHDPSIRNHTESKRLRASGWHLTEDQISTSSPLWQFMGQSLGIKYHYRYVERVEKIDGSKLSRIYAILHASVVRDLVRRYQDAAIEFAFEEFTGLNSKFNDLVNFCASSVDELDDCPPTVKVVAKGESDLSSLADYMILGMSRLIGQNEIDCYKVGSCGGSCKRSVFDKTASVLGHVTSASFHYRNFENIRRNVSSAIKVRLHTGILT